MEHRYQEYVNWGRKLMYNRELPPYVKIHMWLMYDKWFESHGSEKGFIFEWEGYDYVSTEKFFSPDTLSIPHEKEKDCSCWYPNEDKKLFCRSTGKSIHRKGGD